MDDLQNAAARIYEQELAPIFKNSEPEQSFHPSLFKTVHNTYRPALRAFLSGQGKLSPSSHYKILGDELWFIRPRSRNRARQGNNRSICAKKINGIFFGNATDIYAKSQRHRQFARELAIQRVLGRFIPMVPFSLFKESKLDISQLEIIDKGKSEQLDLGRTDKDTGEKILQHFTGAMLFRIQKEYFVFDIDRNELELKNFNAWMSKLRKPCKTLPEAYASLKPDEVTEAEKFMGKPCQRQGEWFFIPVNGNYKPDTEGLNATTGWAANFKKVAKLEAKGNRPHFVEHISKEGFVKGEVTHGGNEHKAITLKHWCKAVPNAAVESYKISGMID